jgi:flagellin
MTVINTNINANIARDAIGRNDRAMATSMERLSTGLRINSAKDDAAGLAIANRMAGQISGLNMAKRNANDGMSMIQTIEGASKEVGNMLVRMRELAVQSASGTYSDSDRAALDLEFDQLRSEITRIQEKTTWNNQALMDGGKDVNIQLGASSGQTMKASFADWSVEDGAVYGTAAVAADAVPEVPAKPEVPAVAAVAAKTEKATVTFANLKNGESITVGGLTLTAAADIAAADVAAGFASLAKGVTAGNAVTNGTWKNALTDFSTGTASTNDVTFTSATADSNVTDLVIASTGIPTGIPTAVTTDGDDTGPPKVTESSVVTFGNLKNGESITVGGLTLTAAADIAAADVAAGFASLAKDVTAGNAVTNGTWSNALTGFSTGTASTNDVTFTSATADSNVTNIVISGTSGSATNVPTAVTVDGAAAEAEKPKVPAKEAVANESAFGDAVLYWNDNGKVKAINIDTAAAAEFAIDQLDKAILGASGERAKYGAYMSRLEHSSDNLLNVAQNTDQSRSRIEDADYAVETSELARTQIISQAATAMLAQANQAKQGVLQLLQ